MNDGRRGPKRRIAVVTADTVAPAMAGPAIRAMHLSAALAEHHEVRLASTGRVELADDRFTIEAVDDAALRDLAAWSEVFVFQGWILAGRPDLLRDDLVVVADLYDPMHLEQLEQSRDQSPTARRILVQNTVGVLNDQMGRADFMLCASEKQRSFWLGQLAALGRVNPRTYDEEGSLRALLDVVPFGVSDNPPVRGDAGLRGVVPGIGAGDLIVLWGGGVYNWFDPLTLVRAVDRVKADLPSIRLVFMGMKHPNPEVPEMSAAVATRELAAGSGLVGRHVFFHEGWVPYDRRQDVLLDADIGVSIHHPHLETEFSFRTRVLDYLWCGLPVVATAGDSMAELIDGHGAGIVVPPGDVDALAAALLSLGDPDRRATCSRGAATLADGLRWSKVVAPLVRFCADPRPAPDRLDPEIAPTLASPAAWSPNRGLRHDLSLARSYLREGGVRRLASQVLSRLRHLGRAAAKRRSPS